MPSMFDRFVGAMWPEFQALTERVNQMAITQAQADAAIAKLQAGYVELEKDVRALMANQQVGAPMSQETYDRLLAIADAAAAAGKIYEPTTEPAPTPEV
jgi:hypothetical protein